MSLNRTSISQTKEIYGELISSMFVRKIFNRRVYLKSTARFQHCTIFYFLWVACLYYFFYLRTAYFMFMAHNPCVCFTKFRENEPRDGKETGICLFVIICAFSYIKEKSKTDFFLKSLDRWWFIRMWRPFVLIKIEILILQERIIFFNLTLTE